MSRILLIDGDIIAYKASAAVEVAIEWEEGYWTWHSDFNEVQTKVEHEIDRIMDILEGDEFRICLTDDQRNFRKDILPTYKGNRANVKKPLVLKPIREWLIEEKDAVIRPGLEGDDVMGILATWDKLKGEKIIVSLDKDMKTVPGLYVRDLEQGIVEISEAEANYWFLYQTLTGDQTDGYGGCPGIGPKKAEAILAGLPMAGTSRNQSGHGTTPEAWSAVVTAYEKAGLTERHALIQARCARILRASDYDFKNKKPILWTP